MLHVTQSHSLQNSKAEIQDTCCHHRAAIVSASYGSMISPSNGEHSCTKGSIFIPCESILHGKCTDEGFQNTELLALDSEY